MGQVPDDLNDEIPAVEAEVDALRERTQQIVAELERRLRARAAQARTTIERVRRATDVRAQIKAHPGVTAASRRWRRSRSASASTSPSYACSSGAGR